MSTELTPSMRRSVLIAALRDPSMWPEGFEWEFNFCKSCAIGLCVEILHVEREPFQLHESVVCSALGLTWKQTTAVFMTPAYKPRRQEEIMAANSAVTPAMVADRLEQIHRELEGVP